MRAEELLRTLQQIDPCAIFSESSLDTPYSKYSPSNYASPVLEITAIREIITHHQEQLKAVDAIIEQVESILHQFRKKRNQVVSSIKAHEGFASCIRRLPADILREIFMQCLPNEKYLIPNPETAPLLLTRVCRSWRDVALDSPRLWSSLSIIETSKQPEEQTGFYHEYWLKNAKLCPLSLKVGLIPEYHGEWWTTTALDFSRRYTARCTELSVYFVEAHGLDCLLEEVPMLECLCLSGDMDMPGWAQTISIVQRHPRLRTLIIESSEFPIQFLPNLNPGWTKLTRLAVLVQSQSEDVDVFSALLKLCPNLEQFVFSPVRIHKRGRPVSLTHPKLRVLGIMRLYGDGALLDNLTLPSLRHLHVRDIPPDASTVFEDIPILEQPLLEGSGHRSFNMTGKAKGYIAQSNTLFTVVNPRWTEITHLTLNIRDTEEFVPIPLEFCPNLEEIVFSSIDVIAPLPNISATHDVLRSFTIRVNFGPLATILEMLTLPGLRHLNLGLPESSEWPQETLKEFLLRSQCPLETLKINGPRVSIEERKEVTSLIPTVRCIDLNQLTTETWGDSEASDTLSDT